MKLPDLRELVLNKETKVSNGVYGRKAEKRTPPMSLMMSFIFILFKYNSINGR